MYRETNTRITAGFFFFGRNYQTDFKMYLRKQSILKNQDNFEIKHI